MRFANNQRAGLLFLSSLLLLLGVTASAQNIVHDVQYNSTNPGGPSPLVNQRVRVAAIVTATGLNDGAGGGSSFFIQDRDTTGFHGVFVRNSVARAISVGDSVYLVGTVMEAATDETRIACYSTDSVVVRQTNAWTPAAPHVTLANVQAATAEQWEGMLIAIPNVTVRTVGGDYITITDGTDSIQVGGYGSGGRWALPCSVGVAFRAVVGTLRQTGSTTYRLEPRSDGDMQTVGNNGPIISNVSYTPGAPTPYDRVTINANVYDLETSVTRVWIETYENGLPKDTIDMVRTGDRSFALTRGPWLWHTLVRFRVKAKDDQGVTSISSEQSFTTNFTTASIPLGYFVDHPDVFIGQGGQVEGKVVYVQPRSTSSSVRTDAYLVDTLSGAGMYISESSAPANYPQLTRGFYVRAPVTFTQYSNALEVYTTGANQWVILDSSRILPRPTLLRTGDISLQRRLCATGNPNYYASGTFVQVTGTVISVDINVGGGTNILIDDGSGTMAIRVWDASGLRQVYDVDSTLIPITAIAGKVYTIRGIASKYNTDFQMLAAYREDFIAGGASLGLSNSTFVDVPARVINNDLGDRITIRYGAPALGRVQVRVFNLKGQVVASLVDKMSNGVSEIPWDGRDDYRQKLPLGTYILQVLSNDRGSTKSAIAPIVIGTKL